MCSAKESEVSKSLDKLTEEGMKMEVCRMHYLGYMKQEILRAIHEQQKHPIDGNHDQLSSLSTQLWELVHEGLEERAEHRILDSLCFETMEVRHAKIPEAHARTFQWIFDDSAHQNHPHIKFGDWLSTRDGFYWAAGKADSCESTLMKFLCDHARTKRALREWAGHKKLVVASFFF
jgi:hypothetical protein